MNDTIYRQDAINLLKKWSDGYNYIETETESAIEEFQRLPSAQSAEPKWHDCDPTDKNTLPEPGSWAIWCDKEDHKIIARWKEDAIDHFWPDQRIFDFDLEDAVAWIEIPKRTKNTNEPETSRIENALHGKSAEEQYDFIWWLLQNYAMNFTDSRRAAIEWLKGGQDEHND